MHQQGVPNITVRLLNMQGKAKVRGGQQRRDTYVCLHVALNVFHLTSW